MTPDRRRLTSGSEFERLYGYARAVVEPDPHGDWVFVAGTTGFDYATGTISDDPAEQTRQTLATIAHALAEAGGGLEHVVRARYIIPDPADVEAVLTEVGRHFAEIRPAATALLAGLIDPRMKIEIEVTARLPAKA
jgi:enamine deaminase RidA (YjgF/YER057c/UK114 family)